MILLQIMVTIDALTMLAVLFLSRALILHLLVCGQVHLFLFLTSSTRNYECPSHLVRRVIEAAPNADSLL